MSAAPQAGGGRHVLDTSALLSLHNDEAGSARVEQLLLAAADGQAEVFGCFMSLMEVFYRVWKNESEAAGRTAYLQCRQLPVTWVHESPELLELAASLKARHPMSLADAWIAATAIACDAVLVHKDPEFESVRGMAQEQLPYK